MLYNGRPIDYTYGITSGATEQISNLSTGTIKVKRVANEQSLLMAVCCLRYYYPLVYDGEHDVILWPCNSMEYFGLLQKFINSSDMEARINYNLKEKQNVRLLKHFHLI